MGHMKHNREAVLGRGQDRTFAALTGISESVPFSSIEIRRDNDTAFMNLHLLCDTQREAIVFSRSRPYEKKE